MNILYGAKNVVLYYVLFHLILFYTYYSFFKMILLNWFN